MMFAPAPRSRPRPRCRVFSGSCAKFQGELYTLLSLYSSTKITSGEMFFPGRHLRTLRVRTRCEGAKVGGVVVDLEVRLRRPVARSQETW